MPFTGSDICKIILAIFLPPLGVFAEKGKDSFTILKNRIFYHLHFFLFATGCDCDLLINIGLTLLGYLPGIIHALYIIFKY